MLIPVYTTRFEKDLKRMRKRGCDVSKIKAASILLINNRILALQDLTLFTALKAFNDSDAGKGIVECKSAKDMFRKLDI